MGELIKVFNEISNELKNHYLLAYTPTQAPDGSWREIALKVNRPDAEVRCARATSPSSAAGRAERLPVQTKPDARVIRREGHFGEASGLHPRFGPR